MWEPGPVLCSAADCTVNTEKVEVTLVSSSFAYSHIRVVFMLLAVVLTGNYFTVHLQF